MLSTEMIFFLTFSVFGKNGHVQHPGGAFLAHHSLCYHLYFVFDKIELAAAAKFSYGGSLPIIN